jgi:hypothetical protein
VKTSLLPGETRIFSGAANLQRGIETVGGHLFLTSHRLVFESHAFNVQTGVTIISLQNITGARKCWTKLLNFLPLFPNSVAVATSDGKEYRLVLADREEWIHEITAATRHCAAEQGVEPDGPSARGLTP